MELIGTISLTNSTYCPPDPSIILPSDEKNDISVRNDPNKIKRLLKVAVSLD